MSSSPDPIMTAVITGDHPFGVVEFIDLFRSLPGIDFYPQSLVNWAHDMSHVRDKYEVLLFFNMHREPPNLTFFQDEYLHGGHHKDRTSCSVL